MTYKKSFFFVIMFQKLITWPKCDMECNLTNVRITKDTSSCFLEFPAMNLGKRFSIRKNSITYSRFDVLLRLKKSQKLFCITRSSVPLYCYETMIERCHKPSLKQYPSRYLQQTTYSGAYWLIIHVMLYNFIITTQVP